MQGPVCGLSTIESELDNPFHPNFHYDDIFGTVVSRFLVQAVSEFHLPYGKGEQTSGYLHLKDNLQYVDIALNNPTEKRNM